MSNKVSYGAQMHMDIFNKNWYLISIFGFVTIFWTDPDPASQDGGLIDISPELLQLILTLLSHEKYRTYGITDATYRKFLVQFGRDFPPDRCPLVLAPLIYNVNTDIPAEDMSASTQSLLTSSIMDTSWANLIVDIGKCSRMWKSTDLFESLILLHLLNAYSIALSTNP